MFKTESHMHTSEASYCSRIDAREMVRLHAEAGYTTLFVSDHFSLYHFGRLNPDLTWDERMEIFFGAYDTAKAAGEEFGINVLFSPELTLHDNHFLLYGVQREFLADCPEIFDMSYAEFRKYAEDHGVTVIQAHPFRDDKFTPVPEYVDAVEAVNSNPRHKNFDERVFELAKQHCLPVTAGSDAHKPEDIGGAAMLSEEPIESEKQYIDLLMAGKLKLMRWGEIVE